jgi:hypothetical protein
MRIIADIQGDCAVGISKDRVTCDFDDNILVDFPERRLEIKKLFTSFVEVLVGEKVHNCFMADECPDCKMKYPCHLEDCPFNAESKVDVRRW